jgi:response regulator RpfG family c-di-GMP phosphodiesterase
MVTKRPYRKPHTAAATLEHLAGAAGRLYDPVVTNALERVLRPKERRSGSPAAA